MNDQTKIPAGFVSAGDASRILGVSTTTLRSRDTTKHRIIYARVSTRKQQENLQRQVDFLQSKYPTYELIRDFGSGINFKRRGFTKVLDYAIEGNLEELVVAYRDRLCRIGFEFIKTLFDKLSGTSIVVLDEGTGSPDEELVQDIIAITTVFSATINGRKRYKKNNHDQSSAISNNEGKKDPQPVVRNGKICVQQCIGVTESDNEGQPAEPIVPSEGGETEM
jgi:putative resolvase